MSFLALHRSESTSLATSQLWLSEGEITRADTARELLDRLRAVLASRQAELAAAREQAQLEGYAAGRREALEALAPRLADTWDQAARSAAADVDTLRQTLVALSLQVVQRVADSLAPADVVSALAARAAEALLPDSGAVVRVHPDVAAAVRARLQGSSGVLDVRADPQLGPYDCAFDTPAGQLLAGLPAQLARLSRVLQEGS
jgi:flagellar biosynthesis/type III secretory pathway protein FliH